MNKKINKLLVGLVIGIVTIGLIGCGNDTSTTTTSNNTSATSSDNKSEEKSNAVSLEEFKSLWSEHKSKLTEFENKFMSNLISKEQKTEQIDNLKSSVNQLVDKAPTEIIDLITEYKDKQTELLDIANSIEKYDSNNQDKNFNDKLANLSEISGKCYNKLYKEQE